jgi:hypothetical protein
MLALYDVLSQKNCKEEYESELSGCCYKRKQEWVLQTGLHISQMNTLLVLRSFKSIGAIRRKLWEVNFYLENSLLTVNKMCSW